VNKDEINYKLAIFMEQLTQKQIFWARRNRDWQKFDKLTDFQKLLFRLYEFEEFVDFIDPNYKPKYY
jgi:hypothetical protein